MAIKQLCAFSVTLIGDGTTTSITVNTGTAPMTLNNGKPLPAGFSLTNLVPTDTYSVTTNIGVAASASLGLLEAITFTFGTPPPNYAFDVLGFFVF